MNERDGSCSQGTRRNPAKQLLTDPLSACQPLNATMWELMTTIKRGRTLQWRV